jgi:hypothetical protein
MTHELPRRRPISLAPFRTSFVVSRISGSGGCAIGRPEGPRAIKGLAGFSAAPEQIRRTSSRALLTRVLRRRQVIWNRSSPHYRRALRDSLGRELIADAGVRGRLIMPSALTAHERCFEEANSPSPFRQGVQMDQICRPNPGFSETPPIQRAADIMWRTLDSHD